MYLFFFSFFFLRKFYDCHKQTRNSMVAKRLKKTAVTLATLVATSLPITIFPAETERPAVKQSAVLEQTNLQFTNKHFFNQTALQIMGQEPMLVPMTVEAHVKRLPEAVRAEMAMWLTDYRSTLTDGYRRFKFLEHIVGPEYDAMGLPRELAAGTGITESAFRRTAVSPVGAEGLWQIMPRTGKDLGLKENEAFDPAKATPAHRKYFLEKMNEYDGDILLSLAAYNAGSSAVNRFLRNAKAKDFWAAKEKMYEETRLYSPRSVAIVELISNAAFYNFAPFNDGTETSTITLPRAYHLDEAGICLGENIWNLENLNPHADGRLLDKGDFFVYPAEYDDLIDGCILGEQGRVAFLLSEARNPDEVKYLVRPGDYLNKIAAKHKTSAVVIARRNKITLDKVIHPGQVLYIPQNK